MTRAGFPTASPRGPHPQFFVNGAEPRRSFVFPARVESLGAMSLAVEIPPIFGKIPEHALNRFHPRLSPTSYGIRSSNISPTPVNRPPSSRHRLPDPTLALPQAFQPPTVPAPASPAAALSSPTASPAAVRSPSSPSARPPTAIWPAPRCSPPPLGPLHLSVSWRRSPATSASASPQLALFLAPSFPCPQPASPANGLCSLRWIVPCSLVPSVPASSRSPFPPLSPAPSFPVVMFSCLLVPRFSNTVLQYRSCASLSSVFPPSGTIPYTTLQPIASACRSSMRIEIVPTLSFFSRSQTALSETPIVSAISATGIASTERTARSNSLVESFSRAARRYGLISSSNFLRASFLSRSRIPLPFLPWLTTARHPPRTPPLAP